MIKTKPELPVRMLMNCPAVRPSDYSSLQTSPPEYAQPAPEEAAPSNRNAGIVAATVHLVRVFGRTDPGARFRRLCRSATKGLNMRFTDVKNSTTI